MTYFDLINSRPNVAIVYDSIDLFDIKVWDADRPGQTKLLAFFHAFPGF